MADSTPRTRITTPDGRVYDLSGAVTIDADIARRSVDDFATAMRRMGVAATSTAATISGTLTAEGAKALWDYLLTDDDEPQLFFAFDPAVSEEWVDTIRPLPDIRSA